MGAFSGIPVWLQLTVIIGVGFLVAALFSWLASRFVEDDVRSRASGSVTTVLGVVAALYAVLVAFVIVNEWQSYETSSTYVSDEAAALATIYANATVMPAAERTAVQREVFTYVRTVLCQELPELRSGRDGLPEARESLLRLFTTVAAAERTGQPSAVYDASYSALDDLTAARRNRIDSASSAVPPVLMWVVVVGGVVLIAVATVLDTKHRRWHIALTAAVTLIVCLNVALIAALDRPYQGAATVSDTPLREGVPPAELVCRR